MELKKRLNKVAYSRSYIAGRELPIVIAGNSRWARDLELLMEDQWSQLFLAVEEKDLNDQIYQLQPRLFVIEFGIWNNSEKRLIEAVIPNATQKLIITPEVKDQIGWKRVTKEIAQFSVPTAILDPDAKASAAELNAIFEGLINNQRLAITADISTLKSAYEGFRLAGQDSNIGLQAVARKVLSAYAIPVTDLQATMLLCETLAIQRSPLLATSDVFFAIQSIRRSVTNQNCIATIKLIEQLQTRTDRSSIPSEEWKSLFETSGFGKLAIRQFMTKIADFQMALGGSKGTNLLKVA